MISCKRVTKEYGGNTVLHEVSFEVERGRICVLAGPNGAGKSTLIKILTGQISAANGSAHVNGIPVSDRGVQLRKNIGVVPENLPSSTI